VAFRVFRDPNCVACLLTAGDGRDEQRALRWKAARKVQELKLAQARVSALVHGGGKQELESLLDFGRLSVERRNQTSRFLLAQEAALCCNYLGLLLGHSGVGVRITKDTTV
jgi:hypothetical protein